MRWLAVAVVLVMAARAAADDKVLVLRAEGRADKNVRAKVEGAVLKLARTQGDPTAGDITFVDAAAMVGCDPGQDKCKDEVLGMLSVDEIVAISAAPKPGGVEVSVRRIRKGGITKSAVTVVSADKADQLDAISPLFGGQPAVAPPPREPIREPVNDPPPPADRTPPIVPPPATVAQSTSSEPATTPVVDEPRDDARPDRRRKLAMIGMAGGGAMLLVGIVFWASAANVEDEIADAPKRTRDDLERLRELEQQGDDYATAGNVLAIGGLILGGVSTYYFLKTGKRSSRSAAITPIRGGGVAVTWGGSL